MPFSKDIVEAFFDLDLDHESSGPPTASTSTRTRDPKRLAVSKPSPTSNGSAKAPKCALLRLPVELRLHIYEELLVSRFDRAQNPSWAVGNTSQKMIILHMVRSSQYRTMEPALLQTCKQIRNEANAILYSQNVFKTSGPGELFRLLKQIGPTNFKLIRKLRVWVNDKAEPQPWLRVFCMLAEKGGVRSLELGWGASTDYTWLWTRGSQERGLGDNLELVRALGRIPGLESLAIHGFYAKHWPAFLQEQTGARVQAVGGLQMDEPIWNGKSSGEDHQADIEFVRTINATQLETFKLYQEGIDDLVP
jgi:hypothetical protein